MSLSSLTGAGALRELENIFGGLASRPGADPRPLRTDRHSSRAYEEVRKRLEGGTGKKLSAYDRKLLRNLTEEVRKSVNTANAVNTGRRDTPATGRLPRKPRSKGKAPGTYEATVVVVERNTVTGDLRRRPPAVIGGLMRGDRAEILDRVTDADLAANPSIVAPPPPTYRGGRIAGREVGRWEVSDIKITVVYRE